MTIGDFSPNELEIRSLGIGVINQKYLDLSTREYLVVGDISGNSETGLNINSLNSVYHTQFINETSDYVPSKDVKYSTIINNTGIGINTSRNTMDSNFLANANRGLYVEAGDIICEGTIKAKSIELLEGGNNYKFSRNIINNSNFISNFIDTINSNLRIIRFEQGWTKNLTKDASKTNIFTESFINIGGISDTVDNFNPVNIISETDTNKINNIHLSIKNKQDAPPYIYSNENLEQVINKEPAALNIGIIGSSNESPAIISTTKNMPLEFHISRFGKEINDAYGSSNTLPNYYDDNFAKQPNMTITGDGNIAIKKNYVDNINENIKADFQVHGYSLFSSNTYKYTEDGIIRNLDDIYVKSLGKSFEPNQLKGGTFANENFKFNCNVDINTIYGDTLNISNLNVYNYVSLDNPLTVNNTLTINKLIINSNEASIIRTPINFEDNTILNNATINGDLNYEGNRVSLLPINNVEFLVNSNNGSGYFNLNASNILQSEELNSNIVLYYHLDDSSGFDISNSNMSIKGKMSIGLNNADVSSDNQLYIKKNNTKGTEIAIKDSKNNTESFIGHQEFDDINDNSLIFNTNYITDKKRNIYFYSGIDNQHINDKEPTLSILQNNKIGINIERNKLIDKELYVNGKIYATDIYINNEEDKAFLFINHCNTIDYKIYKLNSDTNNNKFFINYNNILLNDSDIIIKSKSFNINNSIDIYSYDNTGGYYYNNSKLGLIKHFNNNSINTYFNNNLLIGIENLSDENKDNYGGKEMPVLAVRNTTGHYNNNTIIRLYRGKHNNNIQNNQASYTGIDFCDWNPITGETDDDRWYIYRNNKNEKKRIKGFNNYPGIFEIGYADNSEIPNKSGLEIMYMRNTELIPQAGAITQNVKNSDDQSYFFVFNRPKTSNLELENLNTSDTVKIYGNLTVDGIITCTSNISNNSIVVSQSSETVSNNRKITIDNNLNDIKLTGTDILSFYDKSYFIGKYNNSSHTEKTKLENYLSSDLLHNHKNVIIYSYKKDVLSIQSDYRQTENNTEFELATLKNYGDNSMIKNNNVKFSLGTINNSNDYVPMLFRIKSEHSDIISFYSSLNNGYINNYINIGKNNKGGIRYSENITSNISLHIDDDKEYQLTISGQENTSKINLNNKITQNINKSWIIENSNDNLNINYGSNTNDTPIPTYINNIFTINNENKIGINNDNPEYTLDITSIQKGNSKLINNYYKNDNIYNVKYINIYNSNLTNITTSNIYDHENIIIYNNIFGIEYSNIPLQSTDGTYIYENLRRSKDIIHNTIINSVDTEIITTVINDSIVSYELDFSNINIDNCNYSYNFEKINTKNFETHLNFDFPYYNETGIVTDTSENIYDYASYTLNISKNNYYSINSNIDVSLNLNNLDGTNFNINFGFSNTYNILSNTYISNSINKNIDDLSNSNLFLSNIIKIDNNQIFSNINTDSYLINNTCNYISDYNLNLYTYNFLSYNSNIKELINLDLYLNYDYTFSNIITLPISTSNTSNSIERYLISENNKYKFISSNYLKKNIDESTNNNLPVYLSSNIFSINKNFNLPFYFLNCNYQINCNINLEFTNFYELYDINNDTHDLEINIPELKPHITFQNQNTEHLGINNIYKDFNENLVIKYEDDNRNIDFDIINFKNNGNVEINNGDLYVKKLFVNDIISRHDQQSVLYNISNPNDFTEQGVYNFLNVDFNSTDVINFNSCNLNIKINGNNSSNFTIYKDSIDHNNIDKDNIFEIKSTNITNNLMSMHVINTTSYLNIGHNNAKVGIGIQFKDFNNDDVLYTNGSINIKKRNNKNMIKKPHIKLIGNSHEDSHNIYSVNGNFRITSVDTSYKETTILDIKDDFLTGVDNIRTKNLYVKNIYDLNDNNLSLILSQINSEEYVNWVHDINLNASNMKISTCNFDIALFNNNENYFNINKLRNKTLNDVRDANIIKNENDITEIQNATELTINNFFYGLNNSNFVYFDDSLDYYSSDFTYNNKILTDIDKIFTSDTYNSTSNIYYKSSIDNTLNKYDIENKIKSKYTDYIFHRGFDNTIDYTQYEYLSETSEKNFDFTSDDILNLNKNLLIRKYAADYNWYYKTDPPDTSSGREITNINYPVIYNLLINDIQQFYNEYGLYKQKITISRTCNLDSYQHKTYDYLEYETNTYYIFEPTHFNYNINVSEGYGIGFVNFNSNDNVEKNILYGNSNDIINGNRLSGLVITSDQTSNIIGNTIRLEDGYDTEYEIKIFTSNVTLSSRGDTNIDDLYIYSIYLPENYKEFNTLSPLLQLTTTEKYITYESFNLTDLITVIEKDNNNVLLSKNNNIYEYNTLDNVIKNVTNIVHIDDDINNMAYDNNLKYLYYSQGYSIKRINVNRVVNTWTEIPYDDIEGSNGYYEEYTVNIDDDQKIQQFNNLRERLISEVSNGKTSIEISEDDLASEYNLIYDLYHNNYIEIDVIISDNPQTTIKKYLRPSNINEINISGLQNTSGKNYGKAYDTRYEGIRKIQLINSDYLLVLDNYVNDINVTKNYSTFVLIQFSKDNYSFELHKTSELITDFNINNISLTEFEIIYLIDNNIKKFRINNVNDFNYEYISTSYTYNKIFDITSLPYDRLIEKRGIEWYKNSSTDYTEIDGHITLMDIKNRGEKVYVQYGSSNFNNDRKACIGISTEPDENIDLKVDGIINTTNIDVINNLNVNNNITTNNLIVNGNFKINTLQGISENSNIILNNSLIPNENINLGNSTKAFANVYSYNINIGSAQQYSLTYSNNCLDIINVSDTGNTYGDVNLNKIALYDNGVIGSDYVKIKYDLNKLEFNNYDSTSVDTGNIFEFDYITDRLIVNNIQISSNIHCSLNNLNILGDVTLFNLVASNLDVYSNLNVPNANIDILESSNLNVSNIISYDIFTSNLEVYSNLYVGCNVDISGNINCENGNLKVNSIITSNLEVLGDTTTINTNTYETENIIIQNYSDGPAITINNNKTNNNVIEVKDDSVNRFYLNSNYILHVEGINEITEQQLEYFKNIDKDIIEKFRDSSNYTSYISQRVDNTCNYIDRVGSNINNLNNQDFFKNNPKHPIVKEYLSDDTIIYHTINNHTNDIFYQDNMSNYYIILKNNENIDSKHYQLSLTYNISADILMVGGGGCGRNVDKDSTIQSSLNLGSRISEIKYPYIDNYYITDNYLYIYYKNELNEYIYKYNINNYYREEWDKYIQQIKSFKLSKNDNMLVYTNYSDESKIYIEKYDINNNFSIDINEIIVDFVITSDNKYIYLFTNITNNCNIYKIDIEKKTKNIVTKIGTIHYSHNSIRNINLSSDDNILYICSDSDTDSKVTKYNLKTNTYSLFLDKDNNIKYFKEFENNQIEYIYVLTTTEDIFYVKYRRDVNEQSISLSDIKFFNIDKDNSTIYYLRDIDYNTLLYKMSLHYYNVPSSGSAGSVLFEKDITIYNGIHDIYIGSGGNNSNLLYTNSTNTEGFGAIVYGGENGKLRNGYPIAGAYKGYDIENDYLIKENKYDIKKYSNDPLYNRGGISCLIQNNSNIFDGQHGFKPDFIDNLSLLTDIPQYYGGGSGTFDNISIIDDAFTNNGNGGGTNSINLNNKDNKTNYICDNHSGAGASGGFDRGGNNDISKGGSGIVILKYNIENNDLQVLENKLDNRLKLMEENFLFTRLNTYGNNNITIQFKKLSSETLFETIYIDQSYSHIIIKNKATDYNTVNNNFKYEIILRAYLSENFNDEIPDRYLNSYRYITTNNIINLQHVVNDNTKYIYIDKIDIKIYDNIYNYNNNAYFWNTTINSQDTTSMITDDYIFDNINLKYLVKDDFIDNINGNYKLYDNITVKISYVNFPEEERDSNYDNDINDVNSYYISSSTISSSTIDSSSSTIDSKLAYNLFNKNNNKLIEWPKNYLDQGTVKLTGYPYILFNGSERVGDWILIRFDRKIIFKEIEIYIDDYISRIEIINIYATNNNIINDITDEKNINDINVTDQLFLEQTLTLDETNNVYRQKSSTMDSFNTFVIIFSQLESDQQSLKLKNIKIKADYKNWEENIITEETTISNENENLVSIINNQQSIINTLTSNLNLLTERVNLLRPII